MKAGVLFLNSVLEREYRNPSFACSAQENHSTLHKTEN